MLYWGQEQLAKCSGDSYPRFNKLSRNPRALDELVELRFALLDFIADFSNWDNSTDAAFLAVARTLTVAAHDGLERLGLFQLPDMISVPALNEVIKDVPRPLLVDPFAGGGAIPLEGLRCGADTFASDLNPVSVLLNKVVLEYIPKYGDKLADEVEKWGKRIKELAEKGLYAELRAYEYHAFLDWREVTDEDPAGQVSSHTDCTESRGEALRFHHHQAKRREMDLSG